MPNIELQVYNAEIDPNPESDLEVNFIGLVDRPAIERNFQAFKSAHKGNFTLNEEKRIISGPAMIADMPIYRKDDQLGEYLVVFDKAAIRCIVEKFAKKGFMSNFNLFHKEDAQVADVTIFNSFISDIELGISPLKEFEDLADGSWFISAKVNNDDVWQKVKAGTIKGFSVEGVFSYVPKAIVKMRSDKLSSDDIMVLHTLKHLKQTELQAAVIVMETSPLYELSQALIRDQTKQLSDITEWLVNSNASELSITDIMAP